MQVRELMHDQMMNRRVVWIVFDEVVGPVVVFGKLDFSRGL